MISKSSRGILPLNGSFWIFKQKFSTMFTFVITPISPDVIV